MEYTKQFGIAAPELNWVPAPTYILRRSAILDHLRGLSPGKVLEMGCGPGGMLHELAQQGFHGIGVEVSPESRAVAEKLLASVPGVAVQEKLPEGTEGTFDYLLSFEVLEHIEEDVCALKNWVQYLRPGGVVIISVPAHKKRWNITDLLAGHYRRYDRADVVALIESAHLESSKIHTYGWPTSRVIEQLRLWVRQRQARKSGIQPDTLQVGDFEQTKASGVERGLETRLFPIYSSLVGKIFFSLAAAVQRLFYSTDLGVSYLVVARKKNGLELQDSANVGPARREYAQKDFCCRMSNGR